MKSNNPILVIILIAIPSISFLTASWDRTYLADEVSIVFPDTVISPYSLSDFNDSLRLYIKRTDSIEYFAGIYVNSEVFDEHNKGEIEGFDANLFRYVEEVRGYNLKTKKTRVEGLHAQSFEYESAVIEIGLDSTNHRGVMLYYENYWLLFQTSIPKKYDEGVNREQKKFFKSIRID